MKELYFEKLRAKCSSLTENDIDFFNRFFNKEDIYNILKEIDISRKKNFRHILIAVFALSCISFFYFAFYVGWGYTKDSFIATLVLFPFIAFLCPFLGGILSKGQLSSPKSHILPKLLNSAYRNIIYSDDGDCFTGSIDEVRKKGLLRFYNKLDFQKTSIEYYIGESIHITGCEFRTSIKATKNGDTIMNHSYIFKIEFKNALHTIKDPISVKRGNNSQTLLGIPNGVKNAILGLNFTMKNKTKYYLHGDYLYIIYDIPGSKNYEYMHFRRWRSVYANLCYYVDFYLLLKGVIECTRELKTFYYDEGSIPHEVSK